MACRDEILRQDGGGQVVATYDVDGSHFWFDLSLDPDGRTFWVIGAESGRYYQFDI